MRISEKGLNLIKKYEGFSSKPYMCPANVPTIGYGSTYYPNGTKVKLSDDKISEEEATQLLEYIAQKDFGSAANKFVIVDLTQNQFDALVSFAYNIGRTAFENSTLLKLLNRGEYEAAAEQFEKWNKSGGRVLNGLTKRRFDEQKLFLSLD